MIIEKLSLVKLIEWAYKEGFKAASDTLHQLESKAEFTEEQKKDLIDKLNNL